MMSEIRDVVQLNIYNERMRIRCPQYSTHRENFEIY
jgi:hypothetical protein